MATDLHFQADETEMEIRVCLATRTLKFWFLTKKAHLGNVQISQLKETFCRSIIYWHKVERWRTFYQNQVLKPDSFDQMAKKRQICENMLGFMQCDCMLSKGWRTPELMHSFQENEWEVHTSYVGSY